MKRRLIVLTAISFIALAMAVTQHYALQYYWYWQFWWLDIAMHLAGGMIVGLIGAGLGLRRWYVLLPAVVCVGVVWELFEFLIGITLSESNIVFDTATDLVMDTLGGVIAYGMMQWWIRPLPSLLPEAHVALPDQTSSSL
jgi:hypothetical protein